MRVESLARPAGALHARQRQARHAGVEHEAADDGGRGRAARLGLQVRDTPRGRRHDRGRHAARRPDRRRQRRSVDRRRRTSARRRCSASGRTRCGRPASAAWTAGSIGDDSASTTRASARAGRGTTWAPGYAAPSGRAQLQRERRGHPVVAGTAAGEAVRGRAVPAGPSAAIVNRRSRPAPRARRPTIDLLRPAGQSAAHACAAACLPAGTVVIERTAVDNPTRFFVEDLRLALAARGIQVTRRRVGHRRSSRTRRPAAASPADRARESLPLSSLAAYFLKVSQNFYGEMLLKTLGARRRRAPARPRPDATWCARRSSHWGIPADAFVMYDGSGLSRYNYVTRGHDRGDPEARVGGPSVARSVRGRAAGGGHDGTLDTRMKGTVLDAHVAGEDRNDFERALAVRVTSRRTPASGSSSRSSRINFTAPSARSTPSPSGRWRGWRSDSQTRNRVVRALQRTSSGALQPHHPSRITHQSPSPSAAPIASIQGTLGAKYG